MGVWWKYDNADNSMTKKGAAAPNDKGPSGASMRPAAKSSKPAKAMPKFGAGGRRGC